MDEKLYTTKKLEYSQYDSLLNILDSSYIKKVFWVDDLDELTKGMDTEQAAHHLSHHILRWYLEDCLDTFSYLKYDESYLINMTEPLAAHLLSIAWEDRSYDNNDFNCKGSDNGQVFIDSLYEWTKDPDSHPSYFFIAINNLPVTEKSLMLLDRLPKGTELYSADDILARVAVPWKELRHSRMLRALTVELKTLVSILLDMQVSATSIIEFVDLLDMMPKKRQMSDGTRIAGQLLWELLEESLSVAYDRSCICGPRFSVFQEDPKFEVLLTNPELQEPYEVLEDLHWMSWPARSSIIDIYHRLLPAINIYRLSKWEKDDIVDFLRRTLMTEE